MNELHEHLSNHYKKLVETHGNSTKAVGWSSKSSQLSRFELCRPFLLDIVSRNRSYDILDIGSGLGDIIEYLSNFDADYEYVGIEQCEDLYKQSLAKEYKNATFYNDFIEDYLIHNLYHKSDLIVALGSFSWYKDYILDIQPILVNLFNNELKENGKMIITLASTRLDASKRSQIIYHDPEVILKESLKVFDKVSLNHYLHHEFALEITK